MSRYSSNVTFSACRLLVGEDLVPDELNSICQARPLTHGEEIKQGEMLVNEFGAESKIYHLPV